MYLITCAWRDLGITLIRFSQVNRLESWITSLWKRAIKASKFSWTFWCGSKYNVFFVKWLDFIINLRQYLCTTFYINISILIKSTEFSGKKVLGFWSRRIRFCFFRINRKTQKNTTTSLLQVLDNFNFILLLIFFRKTLIILRDANYITVLFSTNNVYQIWKKNDFCFAWKNKPTQKKIQKKTGQSLKTQMIMIEYVG